MYFFLFKPEIFLPGQQINTFTFAKIEISRKILFLKTLLIY